MINYSFYRSLCAEVPKTTTNLTTEEIKNHARWG